MISSSAWPSRTARSAASFSSKASGKRKPTTVERNLFRSGRLERNKFRSTKQRNTDDERAQTLPAAYGPGPSRRPRSVGAAGTAQSEWPDRISPQGSGRQTSQNDRRGT